MFAYSCMVLFKHIAGPITSGKIETKFYITKEQSRSNDFFLENYFTEHGFVVNISSISKNVFRRREYSDLKKYPGEMRRKDDDFFFIFALYISYLPVGKWFWRTLLKLTDGKIVGGNHFKVVNTATKSAQILNRLLL